MDNLSETLVLVLNCGSSSIKFAIFDISLNPLPHTPLWNGKVQGIGGAQPEFGATGISPVAISLDKQHPYRSALQLIRKNIIDRLCGRKLFAIAHRVVHGGSKYFSPVKIDNEVLTNLKSYIPLAPLHQPFALEAIEILLKESPATLQIACFDTGFHHTLPEVEQVLPLPYDNWQKNIRRYGFHGLSYEYLAIALLQHYGETARGRVIAAHLGSGASLCATKNLKSIATTMGFSALDGLMMGTRTGAIDPGVLLYLMETEGLSPEQVGEMLYHRSGLLGLSGISAEPRIVVQHENDQGEAGKRARLSLDLYVRRIVREIGSLTAVLGGLDMLAFTAGVGEHNAFIRERICNNLSFLGLELNATANNTNAAIISTPTSKVLVCIEPTNEEWIAALHTQKLAVSTHKENYGYKGGKTDSSKANYSGGQTNTK